MGNGRVTFLKSGDGGAPVCYSFLQRPGSFTW